MKYLQNTAIWLTALLLFAFSGCNQKPAGEHTFAIGNKTFLLDGKPFVIKAAEIHYTRIPAEYWEHRIQLCKALGMNTICIYAFWNIHEQKPGEFDFSGQNDIADFGWELADLFQGFDCNAYGSGRQNNADKNIF